MLKLRKNLITLVNYSSLNFKGFIFERSDYKEFSVSGDVTVITEIPYNLNMTFNCVIYAEQSAIDPIVFFLHFSDKAATFEFHDNCELVRGSDSIAVTYGENDIDLKQLNAAFNDIVELANIHVCNKLEIFSHATTNYCSINNKLLTIVGKE